MSKALTGAMEQATADVVEFLAPYRSRLAVSG